MAKAVRSTTIRDKDRAIIRKRKEPCGICGLPIDYTLDWRHPMSFTVDHIHPIAKGGPDTLANKQAAHRGCNITKSDRIPARLFVTKRTW